MEQAVQSQGEDRGPTTCRGGGSVPWALESLAWSLPEKFPKFAVMEIVCTHSMGQGEGASQICRSVKAGKKCLGKQKG